MHRNLILKTLPEAEREYIRQYLEPVTLRRKQLLYEVGQPIEYVYFITEGVGSILSYFADGSAVETATVGNEGMVGIGVYLGVPAVAERAIVQVEGGGFRMPAARLSDCLRHCETLSPVLKLYTAALLRMLAQTSACNRRHAIVQRCARWLLVTHDRAGRDTFDLTQQFLAEMLGVRRATVSAVANSLQKAGAINYSRGRITVTDRPRLEDHCCECYGIIRSEFVKTMT